MRFLVRVEPTFEAADALDRAPGGPGPLFGYIAQRFKPEAFYLETQKRAGWWVIDFANVDAMTELTHICVAKTGTYPQMTAVMTGDEGARAIPVAIAEAKKAP